MGSLVLIAIFLVIFILVFPTGLWSKTKQGVDNLFGGSKKVLETYKETFDEETKYNLEKKESEDILAMIERKFSGIEGVDSCYYLFDPTVLSTYEEWNINFYNDNGLNVCLYKGNPGVNPLNSERIFCEKLSGKSIRSNQDNIVFYNGFENNLDKTNHQLTFRRSGRDYIVLVDITSLSFLENNDSKDLSKPLCHKS